MYTYYGKRNRKSSTLLKLPPSPRKKGNNMWLDRASANLYNTPIETIKEIE